MPVHEVPVSDSVGGMTDDAKHSEPGWYRDPRDSTQERWFDGEKWTDQVRRITES